MYMNVCVYICILQSRRIEPLLLQTTQTHIHNPPLLPQPGGDTPEGHRK